MIKANMPQSIPLAALMKRQQSEYINTMERTIRHHDVFLDEDIEDPAQYRDLISLLFNASEDDTVSIFINSSGGSLDAALAIVEGLKVTEARVTAILTGACHSAVSIIALHAHEVAVTDNAYMMCHTAQYGSVGNVGNVKAHTEFVTKMVERLLDDTYTGFLTKDEMAKLKTGVEMWFAADEIRERLEHRMKHLVKKLKKQEKKQLQQEADVEGTGIG